MRVLIDGILYDSLEKPILLVFDENESEIFNNMKRFVSAPKWMTPEDRITLIDTKIDYIE